MGEDVGIVAGEDGGRIFRSIGHADEGVFQRMIIIAAAIQLPDPAGPDQDIDLYGIGPARGAVTVPDHRPLGDVQAAQAAQQSFERFPFHGGFGEAARRDAAGEQGQAGGLVLRGETDAGQAVEVLAEVVPRLFVGQAFHVIHKGDAGVPHAPVPGFAGFRAFIGRCRHDCLRCGRHEAGEPVALVAPEGDDGGIAHAGEGVQGPFHLAQLDTETVDLDLAVFAAEEFQSAVRPVAAQVSRAVQGLPAAGMAEKGRGRFGGIVEVAAGQARPGDVQVTGHKIRAGAQVLVEDKISLVGQRTAVGDAVPFCRDMVHDLDVGPDGGFGGSSEGGNGHVRPQCVHAVRHGKGDPVATEQGQAQLFRPVLGVVVQIVEQQLHERRGAVPDGHALFPHQAAPGRGIPLLSGSGDDDGASRCRDAEKVEHRKGRRTGWQGR